MIPGLRLSTRPAITALILILAALAAMASSAQPAAVPQASDIDWVALEDLSPEQRAVMPDHCCGRYIEPALPRVPGEPGTAILSADNQATEDNNVFLLEGNIRIRQDGSLLQGDTGRFERTTGTADLAGNIRIRQPGMLLVGSDARVEQTGGTGRLNNASYVLHEEGARGTAEIITYTDADGIITIDNGVYTRCEPGDNAWVVQGRTIDLDRDRGRGLARNVTLKLGKVPVLYLPAISFPINDERATGFLAPVIGSTREGGMDFSAPYYLNLAPNYDATLTPRLLTDRGIMLGMEGRYRGQRALSEAQLTYLPGDDLFDPLTADLPNSDSPPVADRWLLAFDHLNRISREWGASIDYSTVSDEDYFQDLGNQGLYNTTRSFLYRSGILGYQNDNWTLTTSALGYQIVDPTVPENRQPYYRLPKINFNGEFYNAAGLEYGIRTEYVNFYRDLDPDTLTTAQLNNGALVNGQRLSLEPVISFPWSTPGTFITPTAKYKYASYQLDDPSGVFTEDPSRGVFMGSLDSGLIFERALDSGTGGLLQTLEPRLFYLYSEYEDQSDIPVFDSSSMTFSFNQLFREDRFSGKDRVGDANQLTLALTSRILDDRGVEKASASIGQIHYFDDREVTINNRVGEAQRTNRSAMASELSWQFSDNWRINTYLEYNSDNDTLDVGNFQFRYQSDINHILNFSYRWRDVPNPVNAAGIDRRIKQTDVSAVWPVSENWGLIARWNYDHANSRNLETIAGFEYNNCCFTVRLIAREWIDNDALFFGDVDDNSGIFLQFELKGLGSVIGGNVSGILNNGISGYREREYNQ